MPLNLDPLFNCEAHREFTMAIATKKSVESYWATAQYFWGLRRIPYVLILCHSSCFDSQIKPSVCLVIDCPTAVLMYPMRDLEDTAFAY